MFRFGFVCGCFLVGCGEPTDSDDTDVSDERPSTIVLDQLEAFLSGRFDSKAQSERDGAYYAIQLIGCRVEAPDLGERVLYIEQASMASLGAPYRQRLYVLQADEDAATAQTEIYALNQPERAVGLCGATEVATFAADDVVLREGCGVFLNWQAEGETFEGATQGEDCASSLGDAAYATSEVWMDASMILSWDRGFDENGRQAWGATAGPYEFERKE